MCVTHEPQVDFEDEPNQLAVIVQESNLPQTKAKYILERFQDYFTFADELTKTTLQIKVTDASQTHLMDMARAARLTIRERRIAVEKAHKEIKADVLREGRAIDGIKNVLLALLEPLEEYYRQQECFIEIKAAEKAKLIELEVQARLDAEFEAEQKAKAEEDARIRAENERLKQEAEEREEHIREERYEAERKRLDAEKKAKYEQEKIKKENDRKVEEERIKRQKELELVRKQEAEKLAKERAEREKVEAELRAKKEAEAKAERERVEKEEALKKAGDKEKLIHLLHQIEVLMLPPDNQLKSKSSIDIVSSVYHLLSKIIGILKEATKEEENDI